jgi:hypothetical protein
MSPLEHAEMRGRVERAIIEYPVACGGILFQSILSTLPVSVLLCICNPPLKFMHTFDLHHYVVQDGGKQPGREGAFLRLCRERLLPLGKIVRKPPNPGREGLFEQQGRICHPNRNAMGSGAA